MRRWFRAARQNNPARSFPFWQLPALLLYAVCARLDDIGVRSSLVPLFAASIAGAPKWLSAVILAVFAVGNGLALMNSGRISDRVGRPPGLLFGLCCSGAFTLFMGWVPWTALIVLAVLAGFGSGFVQPNNQGAIADIVGARNGGNV